MRMTRTLIPLLLALAAGAAPASRAATDLAGCIKKEIEDYRKNNVSERDMYIHCAEEGGAASATAAIRYLVK